MKKLYVLLAILFLMATFVSFASAQEDPTLKPSPELQELIDKSKERQKRIETEQARQRKVFDKIEPSTVSIMHSGRGVGTCSGTIIGEREGKTYVLSAKHCISRDEFEIRVENNKVLSIRTAVGDDIVLLIVDGYIDGKTPTIFAQYETVIGDEVFHLSYPNWLPFRSVGYVIKENDEEQFAVLKSMGGCSGGGMFNDEGYFVGVLWGGFETGGIKPTKKVPITIFEPLSDVLNFLEKVGYEI